MDAASSRDHADGRSRDLVVVANRLPVHAVTGDGGIEWEPSPGGLVAALEPAVSASRTTWVGWTGAPGIAPGAFAHGDIELVPVSLSSGEVQRFYGGFSNSTLWPLYHDAIVVPQFHRTWWDSYVAVNARYADAVATVAPADATVWVHDYQLQLVPQMLRDRRSDLRIGFFLHIPFPAQELFLRLPWRRQIVRGMLGADVVGFQTPVGAQNFRLVAARLMGARAVGKYVLRDERSVLVDVYPVGIDAEKIRRVARSPMCARRAAEIRTTLGEPETILLGVDRLDYTKGIEVRLRAYKELLEDGRIDPDRTLLVQIAEPSRGEVPGYSEIRAEVERLVGEINGNHGTMGRPPIQYLHRSQPFEELVALYRAADVMLVTPFRDGMNLVAKEYVAAHTDGSGVLVLSEFAGAAKELRRAMLVNPFDIAGLKDAIDDAVHGEQALARRRMTALARVVRRNDAARWAYSFLDALEAQ